MPSALNANAATDTGADGAPVLATDGHGTWAAVWESNDTLGGTVGGDPDLVMAHSLDGGAHWSAPHALDPNAATDGRRDVAPQLATDGAGIWNAVWTGSGGALGTDGDIMRAAGRERCGNGSIDPGEQCDDGNTHGGTCRRAAEFPPPPPVATGAGDPGNTAVLDSRPERRDHRRRGGDAGEVAPWQWPRAPTPRDGGTPTPTTAQPNASATARIRCDRDPGAEQRGREYRDQRWGGQRPRG
jgi:hypothetical protein